jgi:hypothetical protein
MDIKKFIVGLTVVLISLSIFADHHRGGMKSMAAVAESWVKAQYTSKEKTLREISKV